MESRSPEDDGLPGRILPGATGKILLATACLLIVGAITYSGAVALRGVWQSQQREDPAAVRARTLENLKRLGQSLHEKGQLDATISSEPPQSDGQLSE